jgi:predicted ribosome quality control (RQC) complex YloA/Tae2 family protein
MGLFGRKKEKVVDWSEKYRLQEKRAAVNKKQETSSELGYLGDMANGASTSENISWDNEPSQTENYVKEKKQKLTKRLLEMTNRIEDLSNQIYHLKQRVELLEKKLKIKFE